MEKPTISSSKPLPDSTSPAPTSQPEKNADTPPNLTDDDLLVTWDSQTDPSCPFNWSLTRWWAITLLCSMGGMVTLMSASMLAPALGSISTDPLNHRKRSKYAFAFGPMALAPLAKVFGRRWVWILSSTWYIPWNTVCGFSHTRGQLLAGRILSGIGASAEYAITTPVLADCWRAEQRGQSFAIATFVPLLGPAIGPILGGIITEKIGWRWLF
ncbi:Major facilitator superfamily domain general substrate transporter [Penicillium majusculum]|nr:Major facilitator superfamily domain general substrate transporter [Penicillium majusculum]